MDDEIQPPTDDTRDGGPDEESPYLIFMEAELECPAKDRDERDSDGQDVREAIPVYR